MANEELRPCPFCGGKGEVDSKLRDGYKDFLKDPDANAYFVVCRSCAADGPWSKSESGARRMWNMRVEVHNAKD